MRWLTNVHDFGSKWTPTAGIGIFPTKASLSQLMNFKNAIRHFRKTICNKIMLSTWKNATETYEMLQPAFGQSCINCASVFEWHKRFKKSRESVRNDERCRWCKEVNTPELIGQRLRVRKRFRRKKPALFKSGRWHFHQDNVLVYNPILVTDYLTKMGIKTVPQPPHSPDLAPCDFWLFPKIRLCRYETIEEMKEALTKVISMLILEDFHGAFRNLLKQ